ncbi:fibrobacter succinogenes major paralogous domain-containing protein [Bacteroidota bacterium]
MRYFILFIALIILSGCGISETIIEPEDEPLYTLAKEGKSKVIVCHRTGNGKYNKIEISDSALTAHLEHGDAQSGDPVPDMPGFIFDENCDCFAGCPPTIEYGEQIYNTVQIGDQCWFKENLNIGDIILGNQEASNNDTVEKYCYDNNPANCATYGGLYQWNEAMQYSTEEGAQGICPDGWHIPTLEEFQTLYDAVGGDGNALKAKGQGTGSGEGTNKSGFSALLAGGRGYYGNFGSLGYGTYFWSSSEYNTGSAYDMCLYYYGSNINFLNYYKYYGFSVRCLMD